MTNSTGIDVFLLFLPSKVKQTNVDRNYLIIWHLKLDTVSQEQTSPVPDCELMKQEHRDCTSHWVRRAFLDWLGQSQTAVPCAALVKIWASLPSQTAFFLDNLCLMIQPCFLLSLPHLFPPLWKYRSCHSSTDSLCWSWQYTLFGLKELRINPPSLTPQIPEPSRHVWGVGFGLFLFFFCARPTVRAKVAGVMDKHTYSKRKGQKKRDSLAASQAWMVEGRAKKANMYTTMLMKKRNKWHMRFTHSMQARWGQNQYWH